MNNFVSKSITIFSDSQSAIAALAGINIKSKTVADCIDKLNTLSISSKVDIKYVRAHADHTGNEAADVDAKLGTKKYEK